MSGRIDYKITMKPQCIPWISAPLPPVFTKLDNEDTSTIDRVIIEGGLEGGSPDEIRSERKSYTIGKPL